MGTWQLHEDQVSLMTDMDSYLRNCGKVEKIQDLSSYPRMSTKGGELSQRNQQLMNQST